MSTFFKSIHLSLILLLFHLKFSKLIPITNKATRIFYMSFGVHFKIKWKNVALSELERVTESLNFLFSAVNFS